MIKIKAIDLLSIAIGAEVLYKKYNKQHHTFNAELDAAFNLKKALYKVNWDDDAELMIEELPF